MDGCLVLRRRRPQNPVVDLLLRAENTGVPDADPQAPEVGGAEFGGNVLETVVAGVAAPDLFLHAARRDVEFIVHDEDLFGLNLEVGRQGLQRGAGTVHVGCGL